MLATYVYARSAHLKLARMIALYVSTVALAYTLDLIRVFAPIEYSYIIQVYGVKFLIYVSFALTAHILYEIIKPLGKFNYERIIYFFYAAPFFMTLLSTIQMYYVGAPSYLKENGWVYRQDYHFLLVNTIIVLMLFGNNIILVTYGLIKSNTFALKRLFRVLMVFVVFVGITSVAYSLNVFPVDYILPPTRTLFLCIISATLLMIFILNLDFMPSTVRKYAALMNSSPTPIIHINNKH